MATGSRSIWYKHAKGIASGETLQTLMTQALLKLPSPEARFWSPSAVQSGMPHPSRWGINRFAQDHRGFLAGQFLSYEPGLRQPAIKVIGASKAFNLSSIAAGKTKEFLEGVCHFVIFKNHVIIAQSRALGSREFELYISQLLANILQPTGQPEAIILADQPTNAAIRRAANKKVKAVTFGTPISSVAGSETVTSNNVAVYEVSGGPIDALKGLLGADIFDKVNLASALEDDNVEVQVTVRVKGRKHISDDAHAFLSSIAQAARHMHEDDIALEIQGVGKLKGSDLKINKTMTVSLEEAGGLANDHMLWDKMIDWFKDLVKGGTITE